MDVPSTIRLLAVTNNDIGDLFNRLIGDLFFAIGYEDLRFNVHKTGRELDIQGTHRLETRRFIAECKAHKEKVGGDALNKFFGVLMRERKRLRPTPVAGYFISLNGFTETGIEQELETGDDRVILLDARRVIHELERSRVIVEAVEAVERSGQCAAVHSSLRQAKLGRPELLGHPRGYLWAVYYSLGKERTHFALIHADGTPLAETAAKEVVEVDQQIGGKLHTLQYLGPTPPAPDRLMFRAAMVDRYRQWLGEECGYIQLDGLPADSDLSAARLNLEQLFVPLRVVIDQENGEIESPKSSRRSSGSNAEKSREVPVGQVLARVRHLALLASPGGGKSTLLKRLAVAYAFPPRRLAITDALPERALLPLFLRCRELRDRAHRPIVELLDDLSAHAGMSGDETVAFRTAVHDALRSGDAILLVDGLDEIAQEGARRAFAQHLRTFIAMFPLATLVVTSRQAGFRLVGGVIASVCTRAQLAPFDRADVIRLCEAWHVEVVGNNQKVLRDARELAITIWQNEHIRPLAENPLLLTTLLVVKRWIGELPRSRASLYGEAVKVLIRTWNVEGYEPLDEQETLAQLSYVACAMMDEGKQRIGNDALLRLLRNARQELEAELQFARISPSEFTERVEYRSSLLMQTGHDQVDTRVEPVFEFRHLTFQEYLCATAYVNEQYPGRNIGRSFVDLLEPHFPDELWREVISLAAVLGGRKAEDIIKRLTLACAGLPNGQQAETSHEPRVILLRQCLLDEVQVTSPTLRLALRQMALHSSENHLPGSVARLRNGKFGPLFQEVAENSYLSGAEGWESFLPTVRDLSVYAVFQGEEEAVSSAIENSLTQALTSGGRLEKVRAALVCATLVSGIRRQSSRQKDSEDTANEFGELRHALIAMVDVNDPPQAYAACFALGWMGQERVCINPPSPESLLVLYMSWRHAQSSELARMAAWAFACQPLLPRDTFEYLAWGDCEVWLSQAINETSGKGDERAAAIVVAWYRRAPWNDALLAEMIGHVEGRIEDNSTPIEILATLGEPGRSMLQKWDREAKRPIGW
jgi:hypothetical protein